MVEPAKGGPALPVSAINALKPGEKLKYQPLHLPDAIKAKAKVAVLLAPPPAAKSQHIVVLDAKPARNAAEWTVPMEAAVVGVIFGPRGLSVKKVSSLVNKDDELVPELADYAQQTETVQALIQTLQQYEQSPTPGEDLNAALQGFSAQYDVYVPKLDPSAPPSDQASTLLRAVLPSLSSYDPLTSGRPATVQQTTGLAASVAAMFFGSPVGLAAGGTALFTNLRSIVSPDTDFRAAFTHSDAQEGLSLCAKPAVKKAHSRTAYLWMLQVPDAAPPAVSIPHTPDLPLGTTASVVVDAAPAQLKLLPRAREWRLASVKGEVSVPVKVEVGAKNDTLRLDLHQAGLSPGEYHLAAKWDWTPLEVAGTVRLHSLGNFANVQLSSESADRLVAGSGIVPVHVMGTDFEFVRNVSILPATNPAPAPKEIPYTLPKPGRDGERLTLDAQVDTSSLAAGNYWLRFVEVGDATHDVPVVVHPSNPTLTGLPLRANLGEAKQTLDLHGTGLERVARITSKDAEWELAPVTSGSHDLKERLATIKLLPQAKKGERLDASLTVEGIEKPLIVAGALLVVGPRPRIAQANASFAQGSDVELRKDEIPSGAPVSFAIRTENVDDQPAVALACADPGDTRQPMTLHPGERRQNAELDFAGAGILFLSLDPGAVGQSGCALTATVSTPDAGDSAPYTLGHVVRLPHISSFTLSNQKTGDALYLGTLTGQDLQIISKTGWNAQTGFPVQGIPTPQPGHSDTQTLKIELPWPPPAPRAPLYIWLRGEATGRRTRARY